VLNQVVPSGRSILLVGFSGGGLIASHLADRMPAARGLITLGANLDLAAWVNHHGYTEVLIARSLPSPFPLRADLTELHVFGARDAITPASLSKAILDAEAHATILELEDVDHTCCWLAEWPRIRSVFQQRIDKAERVRSISALR
jgi:pimeloyl-ACP methyl ester carboxylesterase